MACVAAQVSVFGSWSVSLMDKTPDLVASAVVLISYAITMAGARDTSFFNIFVNAVEIVLLMVIVVFSFVYGSVSNWSNFFPFGAGGVFSGTAVCIFAFSGFDVMANAAEETRDPRRSIPVATVAALAVLGVLYVLATLGLSYLEPYYLVSTTTPFISAFAYVNQTVLKVFATVATLAATSLTKIALAFVGPRLLYALGRDRLLFPVCGYVSECNQMPIFAAVSLALMSAVLAMFSSLSALAEVTSLGYLVSYVAVGVCLLIIRFEHLETSSSADEHSFREAHTLLAHHKPSSRHYTLGSDEQSKQPILSADSDPDASKTEYEPLGASDDPGVGLVYPRVKPAWLRLYPLKTCLSPTRLSCTIYTVLVVLILSSTLFGFLLVHGTDFVSTTAGTIALYVLIVVLVVVIAACVAFLFFFDGEPPRLQLSASPEAVMSRKGSADGLAKGDAVEANGTAAGHAVKREKVPEQVQVESEARVFRVPFVPIIPALAIVINGALIFTLQAYAWILLIVWLIFGMPCHLGCLFIFSLFLDIFYFRRNSLDS